MEKIDFNLLKSDNFSLKTYGIIIAIFQVFNMLNSIYFFTEKFLLADISRKIILGILFIVLNHA